MRVSYIIIVLILTALVEQYILKKDQKIIEANLKKERKQSIY